MMINLVSMLLILSFAAMESISLFWVYLQARTTAQLAARSAAADVDVGLKEETGLLQIIEGRARDTARKVINDNLGDIDFRIESISFPRLPNRAECKKNPADRDCRVLDQYHDDRLAIELANKAEVRINVRHQWRLLKFGPFEFSVMAEAMPQVAH